MKDTQVCQKFSPSKHSGSDGENRQNGRTQKWVDRKN
jgi:hypothetical protein